jgi:hypothetical protein
MTILTFEKDFPRLLQTFQMPVPFSKQKNNVNFFVQLARVFSRKFL